MKLSMTRLVFLGAAAACLPLVAQTTSSSTARTMHERSATRAGGGCVTPAPVLPAKIPALPLGTPCVKPLYTVTHLPDAKLDYVSPMVGEEVRESLGGSPLTFSLDYVDVHGGTGERVTPHKFVTVKYTGYLASDGQKFDSSEDHPNKQPFTFEYGEHRVIPGWDTGFEGMRVGGKRRLFIPWELAYGENGRPPVIPAKAELIFDIEVVSVSDTPPAGPPMRPGMRPGAPQMGRPGAPPNNTPPGSATKPAGTPPQGSAQPH